MAFYNNLLSYGDNIALVTAEGSIRYSELDVAAKMIAERLPARSLLFCICRNDYPSIAGYIGFLQQGVVPVLISSTVDKELYGKLVDIYRPQYIWAPDCITKGESVSAFEGYTLRKTDYSQDTCAMDTELALLLTTSGSTGSPKLVRQTYRNISANTESISNYLGIVSSDRAITTLPMHYTYGLSIIQTHLNQGASLILTETTLMDKEFWRLLRDKKATTFGGVPYTYEMLKRLRFLEMEGLSLRYLTQAGGKLGKQLHYEFASNCMKKGIDFIVMYGATEATARMSYVPADASVEKAGSIGIAIPGGRFELVDEHSDIVSTPNTTGELVYYGENVTPGYAESRDDLANDDERHGRLSTGDMAQVDEDGFYYIVGRKKRFLKMFGNRTNLDEVEVLLRQQGFESACVGEDDHMKIFTTFYDIQTVHDFIAEKLKINRAGFTVQNIDELPRNEAGKILYPTLEQRNDRL